MVDSRLAVADVAFERDAADASTVAIDMLLSRRLQVVAEARAWEGGGVATEVVGTPRPDGDIMVADDHA